MGNRDQTQTVQWEKYEIKQCLNSIIKKTNRGFKIWAEIDTYNFLKKKLWKYSGNWHWSMPEKKRDKNWENIVKIKVTVRFKKGQSHHYWTW